jgi:hypothetical protein
VDGSSLGGRWTKKESNGERSADLRGMTNETVVPRIDRGWKKKMSSVVARHPVAASQAALRREWL